MKKNIQKTWQDLDCLNEVGRQQRGADITDFVSKHPDASIEHELSWLEVSGDAKNKVLKVFTCHDSDGTLIGYAPFIVDQSVFGIELLGRTFFGIPVHRYVIHSQPLFRNDRLDKRDLSCALLQDVLLSMNPNEIAFGLGIKFESSFAEAIRGYGGYKNSLRVMPGIKYKRRLIEFDGDYETYMSGLGSRTRQDLRRHQRRLIKATRGKVECRVYKSANQVEEFLTNAEKVSRRTYQWHLLDKGIKNDAIMLRRLTMAAERKLLRCYLLLCAEIPVAFMVGYHLNETYYSLDIGYDPEWSKFSIGNVLHMFVVEDLVGSDVNLRYFDFMYGDTPNKERLSNKFRWECNYYIAQPTLRWSLLILFFSIIRKIVRIGASILDKYQVKNKVWRFFRRRSVR